MLGERLAACRKRSGLTQIELAVELGDRYSGSMISNVERNRSNLLLDGAIGAARVLGVSLDYLTGLTDDPTPAPERSSTPDTNGHQPPTAHVRQRLRHGHAAPTKQEAATVAQPPASEDKPPAWVEELRSSLQESRVELRDALLRELPERMVAALRATIREPAALTPDQPDNATKLLAFMRPHVVGDDDSILEQIAESAEYDDDPLVNEVRAAAGFGSPVFEESSEHRVIYHRSIVPGWARRETLVWLWAKGKSMEPTVHEGDLIAIDHSYTEPMDGKLFVLHTYDGLVVKRLRGEAYDWQIISDNEAYKPRQAREDDRVIGRVAWSGPPALTAPNSDGIVY